MASRYPFAFWRLRSACAEFGGPIQQLRVRLIDAHDGLRYRQQSIWEAYAWLIPELSPPRSHLGYGDCDGTGTSERRSEAMNIALTEAIERWAFIATVADARLKNLYGFDVDGSTLGMAAAPSLGRRGPRQAAMFEACERWAIAAWWQGRLSHHIIERTPTTKAIIIHTPFRVGVCAIVVDVSTSHQTYGFAFDASQALAERRAEFERRRNAIVLPFLRKHPLNSLLDRSERRLSFFSQGVGREMFMERLLSQPKTSHLQAPRMIIDSAIPGPWSNWCHVWRCLFEPAVVDHGGDDFFFILKTIKSGYTQ